MEAITTAIRSPAESLRTGPIELAVGGASSRWRSFPWRCPSRPDRDRGAPASGPGPGSRPADRRRRLAGPARPGGHPGAAPEEEADRGRLKVPSPTRPNTSRLRRVDHPEVSQPFSVGMRWWSRFAHGQRDPPRTWLLSRAGSILGGIVGSPGSRLLPIQTRRPPMTQDRMPLDPQGSVSGSNSSGTQRI